MSLEGLEGVDLEFVNDCLSFSLSTNIGREISSGSRTVVEISFYPCEVDCLAYPGDANYEQLLNDYLTSLFVELFVTESVLDIQDYDSPVKIGASDYFGFTLPAGKTVKNRFVLRETVVETKDGFIF